MARLSFCARHVLRLYDQAKYVYPYHFYGRSPSYTNVDPDSKPGSVGDAGRRPGTDSMTEATQRRPPPKQGTKSERLGVELAFEHGFSHGPPFAHPTPANGLEHLFARCCVSFDGSQGRRELANTASKTNMLQQKQAAFQGTNSCRSNCYVSIGPF